MSLGIVCSGQGTQSAAMLHALRGHGDAEALISQAGDAVGADLWDLCERDDPRLYDNGIAQPLLCAAQLAVWAVLAPQLPRPRVLAGYSIGELAAAGCAGAIAPRQVIALARQRAHAMDRAAGQPTAMAAVRGLSEDALSGLCARDGVWVAIDNGPDRKVVGGPVAKIETFCRDAEAAGGGVTRLAVRIASHTPMMAPAVPGFREAVAACASAPKVPVLAGIDGAPVFTAERLVKALSEQLSKVVRWDDCMGGLAEMGCRAVLELGPGDSLARMLRDRYPEVPVRSVSEFRSLSAAARWVETTLSAW